MLIDFFSELAVNFVTQSIFQWKFVPLDDARDTRWHQFVLV